MLSSWLVELPFLLPYVWGSPMCTKVLILPITNGQDLTHLCNWLSLWRCVYVCQRAGPCVICSHTWKRSVCFFFSSCSVAWQLSLCFGVPLCWWKWLSAAPTHPTSPLFSQNYRPFVSLSWCSAALALSLSLSYLQPAGSLNPPLTCWFFIEMKISECLHNHKNNAKYGNKRSNQKNNHTDC